MLENEVNLAAVAEHRVGAASGREDFALLWLDEGVGGAVVLGGRVRQGLPAARARSASWNWTATTCAAPWKGPDWTPGTGSCSPVRSPVSSR
ncbi:ROK family protein [Streptacidiphilus monticola]